MHFYMAECDRIDADKKIVFCSEPNSPLTFELPYDKLGILFAFMLATIHSPFSYWSWLRLE